MRVSADRDHADRSIVDQPDRSIVITRIGHRDHQDRSIVISRIGVVITRIGEVIR